MSNNKNANNLISLIRNIINQELSKQQIVRYDSGTVTAVNGSLVDVQLTGDTSSITNIKNETGATLNINDEVVVFKLKDLTNSYVGIKIG